MGLFLVILWFNLYFVHQHGDIHLCSTVDEYIDKSVDNAVELLQYVNKDKPTAVFLHGFSQNVESDSVQTVVNAYLKRRDHNVIAIDYSVTADKNYILASTEAGSSAKRMAEAFDDMVVNGFKFETLHIVGHSLGAQVAGYIGRNVNFTLPRITGLDPAGPGFYFILPHLQSSDATFVDIIHTDAGIYGSALTGHVDFYPNGGKRIQPGCPAEPKFMSDGDFCNHHRSYKYYAESLLQEDAFLSVQCYTNFLFSHDFCSRNKQTVMGYAVSKDAKGYFYLTTNAESPFGRGESGIKSSD